MKYDITQRWWEQCRICGVDIDQCAARAEVIGPYCDGCMGWPVCSCEAKHTGACGETGKEQKR